MTSIQNNYNLLPSSFFNPETKELLVDEATAQSVQAGIQAKLNSLPPISRGDFQQMVANLTPGDVDTPAKLEATLTMFEAALTKLGNVDSDVVAFVGDLAKLLARLMIEQTADQRQNALNDRLLARDKAKGELMNQADQLGKAADKMIEGATTALITGLVGAGLQILGAAVNLAGAFKALGGMGDAQKATQQAINDANKQAMKAAEQAFGKAQTMGQLFGTLSQIGSGLGDATKAGGTSADARLQAEGKKLEAEGSRDAAQAQEYQQIADNKKQMEEALNDMMKQIINFLKEMREAEVDAMRSLTKV